MRSATFSLPTLTLVYTANVILTSTSSENNAFASAFVPSSSQLPIHAKQTKTTLFSERASTDTTFSSRDDFPEQGKSSNSNSYGRRSSEFHSLGPIDESDARRQRREQDEHTKARFATFGDELWDLRTNLVGLSEKLIETMSSGRKDAEQNIRDELRSAERRDPELVYVLELQAWIDAEEQGRGIKAEAHKEEALAARSCLPHMNLEGLWVGKYGEHGYEMINVTYSGDMLTAYKVTGDKNVPRGEITFQVDLSPLKRRKAGKKKNDLKPIKLTESASKKWGTSQLPRYAGQGQVAEEGFVNRQLMDGQLIMIGDTYFSFAWLPISHQIFFGRPSPELALKMLREAGNNEVMGIGTPPPAIEDDDINAMRAFVSRCLDETTAHIEDEIMEGKVDEFSCIWHDEATEECFFE